ncbi:MAG: 2-oxoacid:acceptor oxidoreductase subunit alpha [Anaerolineae bacterium]|jgi:2-oxoglutarate ferredoxin oxidoreductase subunit alpha|nr:2-oxoacid:acceptor oxidoreductase subunit alpha [Anaerolineae bacterium]
MQKIVNDFCITFSNVNGTGSSTANTAVMRALFKMGIPVSGRNVFPSNIKGLPTWFTVRVSKNGYLGRVPRDHVLVLMNESTVEEDLKKLAPGGVVLYDASFKGYDFQNVQAYGIPIKELIEELEVEKRLVSYVGNMIYVGVLAYLLNIEMDSIEQALSFHFNGKSEASQLNYRAVEHGANWAKEQIDRDTILFAVEKMDETKGYIMADGNRAASLGTLYGGAQFIAWYPITPASSVIEEMNQFIPMLRKDPVTGKLTCAVVQAEDELAAVGMIIGAGWAGLRSMTATAGPGLSLMAEYLGLAYYAEIPTVIWDVQRVGPSTGLPTRTAQCDLLFAANISHGDTEQVILLPGSVNECFEFAWKAFDIAERLQTPVLVLSDLDLGMNQWMAKPFEYPDTPMDRGKVLWEDDLDRWTEAGKLWGRYLDVDGDGIPYRTVPGNRHPGATYFTRGTGHDEFARYSEDPDTWEGNLARLQRKYRRARDLVPHPIIMHEKNARVGIITWGSSMMPVAEARDILASKGIMTDYLRVRALPFKKDITDFIQAHDHCYVVENNRDGQLNELLTLEAPQMAYKLRQLSHIDGMALAAEWVAERIRYYEENCDGR